ncbi:MAG: hypothetical protein KBD53_04425 [Candidatus Omnitrophica bacterium]|nr:hypothetical protein [Candidatus Omnitrophota bacterium]
MRKKVFVICFILGISIAASGCQPLRQKFIRKKTKERESKFIPILEPVDYVAASISAPQQYKQHYLIYAVWQKELLSGLEHDDNDKRLKYSLEQLISHLEEMVKFVPEVNKKTLNDVLVQYKSSQNYFEKPEAFRNYDSYISQLHKFERIVRKQLKPEIIFPAE